MANVKMVANTLPPDYALEQAQIARQQQMAQLLQQQSLAPAEQGQMIGKHYVAPSPLAGIAKVMGAYLSRKQGDDLDVRQAALTQRIGADRKDVYARALQAREGTPEMPGAALPPDVQGPVAPTPAVPGSQRKMAEILFGSQFSDLQQLGMTHLMAKEQAPTVLPANAVALGADNKVVASNVRPDKPTEHVINEQIWRDTGLGGYQSVGGEKKAPPGFTRDAAGNLVVDQNWLAAQKDIRAAGKTEVNNKIAVNTEKTLLGTVADNVGKGIAAASDSARAAKGTIRTVHDILDALDSNQVVNGPLAKQEIYLRQIGDRLGIGGKNATEVLTKTREAIRGLAQLELDGAQQMKGQGEITEAERDLIKRASGGDINSLSSPEMRSLMLTLDKVARRKFEVNTGNVARLRKNENAKPVVDFLDVEMPPEYTPKRRAADNQKVMRFDAQGNLLP